METELENTVKRFFEDADYPENLLFSIVSQSTDHPDLSFIEMEQLRYIKINPEDAYGVSWARAVAASQFSNYTYYLQLDAHMFSEKSWDTKLIALYEKEKTTKPKLVLSSYPAAYSIDSTGNRQTLKDQSQVMCSFKGVTFGEWGVKHWISSTTKSYYIQGALLFSEKKFLLEVPIISDVSFSLEETINSIRAYQAGYEVCAFTDPIFYHFYAMDRIAYNNNPKPWDKKNRVTRLTDLENKKSKKELLKNYEINYQKFLKFCKETGLIYE
jgi:hypothetical protein